MNINNGKTGNVNIPGALHSTGGDGDGQVGGVVAYAGDVYDETLGKNQKEINQTLLDGSGDSNVIAVALNDLNEKVEEQEKVTSSGLNDLNDKTDNLNKDIEDLEKTTSSSLNDLKDKVDNLSDKVNDNEKTTTSALSDLDEKTDTNEKAVSAALNDLNNKISDLPLTPIKGYTGSFKNIPKEDSNVVEADETIALGVGVYGDKQRSFGWGSGYQTLWLTGSNSQYTIRMSNPSAVSKDKQPLEALATAWIDGYILTSGTTHTRVAKVTAANFTNGVLTITTDTDLGTLNDTKYTYECKTGQQNFCAGAFINSGRQNIAIGTSNFVTSSFSIIIGTMNGSTTNAKWSITIGEWNNNDGNGGTIVGLDNTLKTSAGTILGTHNSIITSNSNVPSSILGYHNNISSGYGILIGNNNISSGNFSCIFGYGNFANTTTAAFLIGQKLICENSRGGYYIGQYNKEYISNNTSVANWFAVGCGNNDSSRQNVIEVKQNGDTYIYGVGGFTGANSDSASVKPLHTVISDIQTSLSSSSSSSSSEYITYSTGQGYSIGDTTTASGENAFAQGYQTSASGVASHAEGKDTYAIGDYSHAEGAAECINYYLSSDYTAGSQTMNFDRIAYVGNIIIVDNQIAKILSVTRNSNHYTVYLDKPFASDISKSTTIKIYPCASGAYSHTEGLNNLASGESSHAEGDETKAMGTASHAEGYNTKAQGLESHAEGYDTSADGDYSHAEGTNTQASGTYSHAEGYSSRAVGDYSHAEGANTYASGTRSHAEGYMSNAMGDCTHAEGSNTLARNTGEHACGTYNKSTQDVTLFSIGNGYEGQQGAPDTRQNAFEVDLNSNVYIKGIGNYDGTNIGKSGVKSVQQVIADLAQQIAALSNN